MQLRLSEAELRGEHYHGHGITGDQGAHGAGHAAKLGIVKLGKVAGKTKYTLLDERDIGLVHQYTFEAVLDVDRNGHGARITAVCYIYERGRETGVRVADLLWERHRGGLAPGWTVVHRNCVTMDNRLENLMLVPSSIAARWCSHVPHVSADTAPRGGHVSGQDKERLEKGSEEGHRDTSLYHLAMQQLPFDPDDEYVESLTLRYYNKDGNLVEEDDDCHTYYECRYAPCVMMEKGLREFSICGRCQIARYCGPLCQQRDWPFHKKVCKEKHRPFPVFLREPSLDR